MAPKKIIEIILTMKGKIFLVLPEEKNKSGFGRGEKIYCKTHTKEIGIADIRNVNFNVILCHSRTEIWLATCSWRNAEYSTIESF